MSAISLLFILLPLQAVIHIVVYLIDIGGHFIKDSAASA